MPGEPRAFAFLGEPGLHAVLAAEQVIAEQRDERHRHDPAGDQRGGHDHRQRIDEFADDPGHEQAAAERRRSW